MRPSRTSADLLASGRADLPLFLFCLVVYGFFYQGGFDNLNSHFDLSLALAFQHRWAIDSFAANTLDKVSYAGHYFSEKAPGVSYLALPFTLLGSLAHPDATLYAVTVATIGALSSLTAVFFRRFLRALNPELSRADATARTLTIFLGTLLLPYGTMLFSHQFAACFLLLATYAGYRAHYPISALLFGLAVFVEYPAIIPASALALALFARARDRRAFLRALPWVLPPAFVLLAHNAICFGSPFALGYGKLAGSPFADEMSRGFFGVSLPHPSRLVHLTFGPYRGFFFWSPVLLGALAAFPRAWRRERALFVGIAFAASGALLLNASYGYWQGGVCVGPRHLVAVLPLFALALAYLPRATWRYPLMRALIVVSFSFNVIATATTPFISEYDTNPIWHSYRTLVVSSAVAINPNGVLTPDEERRTRWSEADRYRGVSWNWGQRVGLKGWWSLLPLLLFSALFYAIGGDFR